MPRDTLHDPETGEITDAPGTPPPRESAPMPDFGKMLAGEAVPAPDFSPSTERQLLRYLAQQAHEAALWRAGAGRLLVHIAQQNHDMGDSQLAILDATEALTVTSEELLRETRGEGEKKDGKSLNDSVEELTAALERVAEEMRTGRREIPKDTADRVRGAMTTVMSEILEAADGKPPAPEAPEAAPGGAERAAEPAPAA